MDIRSFYDLSPVEFEEVYKKWNDHRESVYRTSWAQARLVAYYSIRPYLKKVVRMDKLIPLPWEKGQKSSFGRKQDPERFEKLKKKYGTGEKI